MRAANVAFETRTIAVKRKTKKIVVRILDSIIINLSFMVSIISLLV